VTELEAEAEVAMERIQDVRFRTSRQLGSIQARLRETVTEGIQAQRRVEVLEEGIGRLNELGRQMQEAPEVGSRGWRVSRTTCTRKSLDSRPSFSNPRLGKRWTPPRIAGSRC